MNGQTALPGFTIAGRVDGVWSGGDGEGLQVVESSGEMSYEKFLWGCDCCHASFADPGARGVRRHQGVGRIAQGSKLFPHH